MPRRQIIRLERQSILEQDVEFDEYVAAHARVGSVAFHIFRDKIINDLLAKFFFQVEGVVFDVEMAATSLASVTSRAEQQLPARSPLAELSGDQSRNVIPITSWPAWARSAAATEESTPPDIATTILFLPLSADRSEFKFSVKVWFIGLYYTMKFA